jgi:hypothetical protein
MVSHPQRTWWFCLTSGLLLLLVLSLSGCVAAIGASGSFTGLPGSFTIPGSVTFSVTGAPASAVPFTWTFSASSGVRSAARRPPIMDQPTP